MTIQVYYVKGQLWSIDYFIFYKFYILYKFGILFSTNSLDGNFVSSSSLL